MRSSAAAFLLVLAGGMASQAFNYNYDANGKVQHWSFNPADPTVSTNVLNPNTHALRFYIASDAYSTTNTAKELNAVRNSFGQWQAVSNTVIQFEEAGLLAPGYDVNVGDNTNVVYWAKTSTVVNGGTSDISGSLGVCFTSSSVSSNSLRQFDIVLNGVQQGWFTDFNDQGNTNYFVEGTLSHEIGHALGVRHASVGGATLRYQADLGIDAVAGLSVDEVAFGRALYSSGNILTSLGHLKGTVTKGGSPVLGAAVVVEGASNVNLAGGTVTLTNGSYLLNALPPGSYNVRVVPLDPAGAPEWLIRGADINSAFANADTSFQPTANSAVTLTAGTTNTLNFAVTAGNPAFRISNIALWRPVTDPEGDSFGPLPVTVMPGQSDLTIGVYSDSLPTSDATFTITGDGLTMWGLSYNTYSYGDLNGIYMWISVASNATPGLRSFVVQRGTDRAYANGYLEILPPVADYNFDGLDDVFQRRYFFPFTSTNAAPGADPDHDAMSNSQENVAGTDPTNAASLLRIKGVKKAANGATVTWQSVTNRHYQVMSRTNVTGGAWQNVGGVFTPTNTTSQLLDTAATNSRRFYRVQVLP